MQTSPLTHAALLVLVLFGFFASSCTLRNTATLESAVDSGSVDAVRRHLNEGTDVNKKDEEGRTPLHISARNGSKKVAEVLIERGAKVGGKSGRQG